MRPIDGEQERERRGQDWAHGVTLPRERVCARGTVQWFETGSNSAAEAPLRASRNTGGNRSFVSNCQEFQ
jgi:hypothetical protein